MQSSVQPGRIGGEPSTDVTSVAWSSLKAASSKTERRASVSLDVGGPLVRSALRVTSSVGMPHASLPWMALLAQGSNGSRARAVANAAHSRLSVHPTVSIVQGQVERAPAPSRKLGR
jgi:hypothetical protein